MNEIIAKLYDQAIVIEDGGDYVCGELDPVKFAMLIIQECLGQVEEQYKLIAEDEGMMSDHRWAYYVDCGVDINAAIREHFGVKS